MPLRDDVSAITDPIKHSVSTDDLCHLSDLERQVRWLSSWTIHHANHVRPKADDLKVGGHQASCASAVTLMTALYFHALRPQDRVAVKPHASPVFPAIQYLLGTQTQETAGTRTKSSEPPPSFGTQMLTKGSFWAVSP